MQRPTHPRLHVRDARDAHVVFEAVRQGLLRPVVRRLNEIERANFIHSGALFVWEESDGDLGLKRWTDGRVWSQSRMREPYLFYDEKLPDDGRGLTEQPRSPNTFRFVDGFRGGHTTPAQSHYDRREQHPTCMGLVKQTYSAWVIGEGNTKPRKLHVTAYFTWDDLPRIPVIDQDSVLKGVVVPAGMYRSGKARSRNSDASMPTSPSVTPPNVPGGGGYAPQASSSRTNAGQIPALPSLHTTTGGRFYETSVPRRGHDARSAEDQRMIGMLNSRHIM
ncbi:Gti1/Pac2 family-domain-containing protein [Amylostereum chailletii]|nr:Gti1/Pac2 family-domain-containing protein [Amylostereum chailletii]